jgi:hypothetical protein
MAINIKPTVSSEESRPAFIFNKEVLLTKLNDYVDYLNEYVGKPKHNPFFVIKETITPLFNRLNGCTDERTGETIKPEVSEALHNEIMSLKFTPPRIIPEDVVDAAEVQAKDVVKLTPKGPVLTKK